jgi:hypothetical protein
MSVDDSLYIILKNGILYCENLAEVKDNLKILEEKMIGLKVMY